MRTPRSHAPFPALHNCPLLPSFQGWDCFLCKSVLTKTVTSFFLVPPSFSPSSPCRSGSFLPRIPPVDSLMKILRYTHRHPDAPAAADLFFSYSVSLPLFRSCLLSRQFPPFFPFLAILRKGRFEHGGPEELAFYLPLFGFLSLFPQSAARWLFDQSE